MFRIGIIGPPSCITKTRKVKDLLFKIKQQFGSLATIYSGGNLDGIEKDVKKFALEFELPYKEFNPRHTVQNLYSYFDQNWYGKNYHFTNLLYRYIEMFRRIDKLVICIDDGSEDKLYKGLIKTAQKQNIKTILL